MSIPNPHHLGAAAAALLGLAVVVAQPRGQDGSIDPVSATAANVALPWSFVGNCGQWDPQVRFRAAAGPMHTWVLPDGWRLQVEGRNGLALDMRFEGANPGATIRGIEQRGTRSWFAGKDPARWVRGAPAFARLRYESLYEGVDLVLRQQDDHVEYDVLLAPGARLDQIVVRCEGMERMRLEDGTLVLKTRLGELRQKPPTTWSVDARGQRTPVECRYVLLDDQRFGFAVDGWEEGTALVVDPGLVWASLLGGSGNDRIYAVFTAPNGETVVAGHTVSSDFPGTAGAFQTVFGGGGGGLGTGDGFVAKLSADGTQLLWATYLGGSAGDQVQDVHVDAQGVVTVAGYTFSTDFPVTPTAFRTSGGAFCSSADDLFVARLDASGSSLLYSTYFGALPAGGCADPGWDTLGGMWVDENSGWVYLTGTTSSNNFPTTPTAVQQTSGSYVSFLSILDMSAPTALLVYSTEFGGTGTEVAAGKPHVDAQGIVTYAGVTRSTDILTTPGAFQATRRGRQDGFVCRIDPSVSGPAGLIYSTYFGGTSSEDKVEARFGPNNVVTVAGFTQSSNLPTTPSAFQPQSHGARDAFVCQLDPAQSSTAQLLWSTYLGSDLDDELHALHVDGAGLVTVAGWTERSATTPFPTTPGAFQTRSRERAGFVARLDPGQAGSPGELVYSTLLHGCSNTEIFALHVDAAGTATLGGTGGPGFPTTPGAVQRQRVGAADAMVARLELTTPPAAVTAFGTSCAGSTGTPALIPELPPELCLNYRVELTGALPSSVGVFFFGASNASWSGIPLPVPLDFIGMTGCTLYTGIDIMRPFATGTGDTTFSFSVPLVLSFIGGRFYNQVIFADLGANPGGLVATNALEAVVRS